MNGYIIRTSVLLSIVLLTACGPKVKLSPEAAARVARNVAILPTNYPEDVQRERVDYLHELLRVELKNSGFFVLDDRVVRTVCRSNDRGPDRAGDCPERQVLLDRYGARTFLQLDVRSASAVSFFAGYYNSLEGFLRVSDVEDTEIARVEHTERERGGVVFESGQVIQGILAQVRNGTAASVNNLGAKFIKNISASVPPPALAAELGPGGSTVAIDSLTADSVRPSIRQVCLSGSKDAIAVLQVGSRKTTLRETSPGKYCGIFRLDNAFVSSQKVFAELRSPFGSSVRKDLVLSADQAGRNILAPNVRASAGRSRRL